MASVTHYLQYLAARGLSGLAQLPSAQIADRLGAGLGSLARRLLASRTELAASNIEKALGDSLTKPEIDRIVAEVFRNVGRTVVELARFGKLGPEGLRQMIQPAGLDLLEQARSEGRGAIIATAHFGNWEIMGVYPPLFGFRSNTLAYLQANRYVNRWITDLRQSMGVTMLPVPASARQVFRALKDNQLVMIAADQHASSETLVIDFFGRSAAVARGPALYSLRCGCPIIPMLIRRESCSRHQILVGEMIRPERSGDDTADERRVTAAYLRFLEDAIKQYPDQWLWTHNRWKIKTSDGNQDGLNA